MRYSFFCLFLSLCILVASPTFAGGVVLFGAVSQDASSFAGSDAYALGNLAPAAGPIKQSASSASTLASTAPASGIPITERTQDPLERINRPIDDLNRFLDRLILKPLAKLYRAVVPKWGRQRVTNVLRNLTEPVTFVNSVLQADVEHSFTTFWRFTINSTLGVAGLFDVASIEGLRHRREDFGQTMAHYGVASGPYLVLPILGPSTVRDTLGRVVDAFTDPFNYIESDKVVITRHVVSVIDLRERTLELLDNIERTSLDPYAAIRSLYIQKRQSDAVNGNSEAE